MIPLTIAEEIRANLIASNTFQVECRFMPEGGWKIAESTGRFF